jgi:chromosome segregation ATPase
MQTNEEGESQSKEVSVEQLQAKINQLEKEKQNVVGELKDVRKSRQELQEQIDALNTKKEEVSEKEQPLEKKEGALDIDALVEEKLQKAFSARRQQEAKENKERALEKFYKKHREFHSDNDTDGAMREKLEKSLNEFRLDEIVSEADFSKRIIAAAQLIGVTERKEEETSNPYSATKKSAVSPSGKSVTLPKHVKDWAESRGKTLEEATRLYQKYPEKFGNPGVDMV